MPSKPVCYAYHSDKFIGKVFFKDKGYQCFVASCPSNCKEVRTLTRHLQTHHDNNYHCKQNPQNDEDAKSAKLAYMTLSENQSFGHSAESELIRTGGSYYYTLQWHVFY